MQRDTVIRTAKHLTITEAHPYHDRLSPERLWPGGPGVGNPEYARAFDPNCPLCRASLPDRERSQNEVERAKRSE